MFVFYLKHVCLFDFGRIVSPAPMSRKTLLSVSTGKAWQWSALKLIKYDALTRASQLKHEITYGTAN